MGRNEKYIPVGIIDEDSGQLYLRGASSGCGRGQKVKKDERITPSATKTI
jgi:hypothetical protein